VLSTVSKRFIHDNCQMIHIKKNPHWPGIFR